MYKLRLSFSGTWHSDGCCCSMVHYENHWGQLKRGHASLISNILWCFPCPRTAAYKGHFFSPRSPAAKREEGLLAAWSCAGMLERGCCFSLFRCARVCSVVLRGPREHQQPANISCKNGGTVWCKGLCTPWVPFFLTYVKKIVNFDIILGWLCVWRPILPCLNVLSLGYLLFSAFLGMGSERTFVTWWT